MTRTDPSKPQTPVLVALGSNIGDSIATMHAAIQRLGAFIEIKRVSSFYRTAPMYVVDQPDFINGALSGNTSLGPLALLDRLKVVERSLGRQGGDVNGPREVDLDLIAYGSVSLISPRIKIPHPKLTERRFVLAPLAEIAPEVHIPGLDPIPILLAATEDQAGSVQLIKNAALSVSSPG